MTTFSVGEMLYYSKVLKGGVVMKKLTRILATVMLAVGTIGLIKPMCIAYFYSPKKPAALR